MTIWNAARIFKNVRFRQIIDEYNFDIILVTESNRYWHLLSDGTLEPKDGGRPQDRFGKNGWRTC